MLSRLFTVLALCVLQVAAASTGKQSARPECVSKCWDYTQYVSPFCAGDNTCLCNDSEFQNAVYQCLYSQCTTPQFANALHYTLAICHTEHKEANPHAAAQPALVKQHPAGRRKRDMPNQSVSASAPQSVTRSAQGSVTRSAGGSASVVRSATRSAGASVTRSAGASVTRSAGASVTRSANRSVTRSAGASVTRSANRSVTRSAGPSVTRSVNRSASVTRSARQTQSVSRGMQSVSNSVYMTAARRAAAPEPKPTLAVPMPNKHRRAR